MYKIIMLPQPILVSEKLTIEEANFISHYQDVDGNFFKIIAGLPDLPKLDLSLIADGIELVDAYKLAYKYIQDEWSKDDDTLQFGIKVGFRQGFETSQSLNEKKYTLSELELAIDMAREGIRVTRISEWETEKEFEYSSEQIIRHLSKPKEYQVEVEMELISNEYDYDEDETTLAHSIESWEQPKITNNTIKILRTI